MPTSKNPRRKYRPNPRGKIIWYSPLDAIDNFVDIFTNIELVCETKLPRGNCNRSDVEIMLDQLEYGLRIEQRCADWREMKLKRQLERIRNEE